MACASVTYAQEVPVRGNVIDHRGHPVGGANVFIKGTVYGASIDFVPLDPHWGRRETAALLATYNWLPINSAFFLPLSAASTLPLEMNTIDIV